jgi:predicted nucleic acid-binding protein
MSTPIAAADTCFLLRYLTGEPAEQADQAEALIRRAQAGKLVLRVPALVIAELLWTLESSIYRLSKADAAEKAIAILHAPGIQVDDADLLEEVALLHAEKNVDFLDAYLVAYAKRAEIRDICTFDRTDFRKMEGIRLLLSPRRTP